MNFKVKIKNLGDKVRQTLLDGLDTTLTGVIAAGDTVLEAFGKLQNQVNQKAADDKVVKLTGDQTVTGEKKFTEKTGMAIAEFEATDATIAPPDKDKSLVYENKFVDGGFKYVQMIRQDEDGNEFIIAESKIEI